MINNIVFQYNVPPTILQYDANGNLLKTLNGYPCTHNVNDFEEGHRYKLFDCCISNSNYIGITCLYENVITLHNTNDGTIAKAKWDSEFRDNFECAAIRNGPKGTVLVSPLSAYCDQHEVKVFETGLTTFKEIETERLAIENTLNMSQNDICYMETANDGGLIVISCNNIYQESIISATSLRTKQSVWRLIGEKVRGKMIQPGAMCSDNMGRLFVADNHHGRMLILDGSTGGMLQVVNLEELGTILHMAHCKTYPFLYVCHWKDDDYQINRVMIEEKDHN